MKDDIIVGRNPVTEAVKSGRPVDRILIQKNAEGSIKKIAGMAKDKKIPVMYEDRKVLDRISEGTRHQGVIAVVSEYQYAEIKDIYAKAEKAGEDPMVVILDGIEDPHNLGAIMRSAECAGAHGIIIPKRGSSGLTSTVAKSSAGAIEYMPCVRVTNISRTIEELQKDGFWVGACDMGETPYYKQDLKGKLAIVIGNEGKGISRLVKEKCDFVLSIPMKGEINSLNASNAACVILYGAMRQRGEQ